MLDNTLIERDQLQINVHGIPLHISDVFVTELGKIAADSISLDVIAVLLAPFLNTLATSQSFVLRERVKDQVFLPLLQSNATK